MAAAPTLRERAVALLARREHTRAELHRKLSSHAATPDELCELLDELSARGWLSDARFAEALVRQKQAKFGLARIAHELRERGVADDMIRANLEQLKDSEFERAREVWQSKFGRRPEGPQERAKQARFLQGRGFSLDIIGKLLRG